MIRSGLPSRGRASRGHLAGIASSASLVFIAGFASVPAREPAPPAREAREARQWEPVEWRFENPSWRGDPFDLVARARFTHEAGGEPIETELFFAGGSSRAWMLRFTGTRPGRWRFRTESDDADLDGREGVVDVRPAPGAAGFLTSLDGGRKWGKLGTAEAFVPQYVMYKSPDAFYRKPETIDADIATFLRGHGFNGFHVLVFCRWFDLEKTRSSEFTSRDPDPDPRTFEALELLIARVHAAAGVTHLWAWGDEQRKMTPARFRGGKNGPVDRRLQRYIAARLGPLPGWSMGYGFDLQEWASAEDLRRWHVFLEAHLGWPHFLGGRSPGMTQIHDGGDTPGWFASYQQYRPDYDTYVRAVDELDPGRPAFFTDRFRVRRGVYPKKDYTEEMVYRALWRSTMAGGAGNIWGYLLPGAAPGGGSRPFPHPERVLAWSRFFRGRFRKGLERDNSITSGVSLRSGRSFYLFYQEDATTLVMDLAAAPGPLPAVAVDARKRYAEIDLGLLAPRRHEWKAPERSDWAIAVGR